MFDSSRPYTTMPVLGSGHRSASAVQRISFALGRASIAMLALAAGAVPVFAAGSRAVAPRRTAAPVHLSHAAVHASAAHAHTVPVHAGSARGHGGSGAASGSAHLRRSEHVGVSADVRSRREPLGKHTGGLRSGVRGAGRDIAVREERGSRHGFTGSTVGLRHRASAESNVEEAANRSTQERVHAWYQSHHPATPTLTAAQTRPVADAGGLGGAAAKTPAPDLSPVAHKATAADFERAAAAQRETIHSVSEQNERQTTAADDDADAQTHIPSTAPTEREPAPFQHGDAPTPDGPASRVRHDPAPITRESPSAVTTNLRGLAPVPAGGVPRPAAAFALAAPAADSRIAGSQAAGGVPAHASLHVPEHTAAESIAPLYRAEIGRSPVKRGAGKTDAAAFANTPVALAADSSPAAIRAVSAEVAASPTPGLTLPAPPALATKKAAPAVATVQKDARQPKLDAAVAQGMANETFDDDSTPVTAKSAVALATSAPGMSPAAAMARAAAAEDDPQSAAASAAVKVNLFDQRGHLVLVPPMKGSHEILVHQNQMAIADGLDRIEDDDQMAEMRKLKLLVALPDEDSMYPNEAMPANRRYARPWTVRFLRDMARAHYARFGTPLIVTSAARTVEFQRHLVRVNGNAAPPTGDVASPHLYGQAVDLAKRGMSLTEIMWMRAYLTPVEADGKIDVEEEFQQSCFHVSVYRRYLGVAPGKKALPKQEARVPVLQEAKSGDAAGKRSRLPTALLATGLR